MAGSGRGYGVRGGSYPAPAAPVQVSANCCVRYCATLALWYGLRYGTTSTLRYGAMLTLQSGAMQISARGRRIPGTFLRYLPTRTLCRPRY
eukprot:1358353-Rhodomonas_salina.3